MSSARGAVIKQIKKIDAAINLELEKLEAKFERKKAKVLTRFSGEQDRLAKMLEAIEGDVPTGQYVEIIAPLKKNVDRYSTRFIKPSTDPYDEGHEHTVLYDLESGFSLERTCPEDEPYLMEEGPSGSAVFIEKDAKARGFTSQRVICFSNEGSFIIQLVGKDEMLLSLYSIQGQLLATTSRVHEFVAVDGRTIRTAGRLLDVGEFAKTHNFVRINGCYQYNIPAKPELVVSCFIVTGDLLITRSLASYDCLEGKVLVELSDGRQAWIDDLE